MTSIGATYSALADNTLQKRIALDQVEHREINHISKLEQTLTLNWKDCKLKEKLNWRKEEDSSKEDNTTNEYRTRNAYTPVLRTAVIPFTQFATN